jgi:hypothetical protein
MHDLVRRRLPPFAGVTLKQLALDVAAKMERRPPVLVLNLTCLGIRRGETSDSLNVGTDAAGYMEGCPVQAIAGANVSGAYGHDFSDNGQGRIVSHDSVKKSHAVELISCRNNSSERFECAWF